MHHPTLSQRYCNNTCSHQSSLCYFSDFTAESRWTQMKTWARTSHESLMKTATPMPCRACFCEFDGSCWYWRLRDIIPAVPWLRTKRKGARPRRPMRARRSNIHHCAWLYACRSDWSVNKHDFQRLLRVFKGMRVCIFRPVSVIVTSSDAMPAVQDLGGTSICHSGGS